MVGPGESDAIRRLSAEAARSGKRDWERDAAARTGGLPVYADMGAVLVLRDDGGVLSVDGNTNEVSEMHEDCWILVARLAAARRHPELSALAPPRPEGAPDCPLCEGRGHVPGGGAVCGECRGTGWRR